MANILISGAGIAGPALAYWLSTSGHDVTVVERADAVRPGGQAVDLRGAGRTVIERMGVMDRVRSVALDQRGVAWVDARGRVTARMPVDAFAGEGIISEIEVLRDDLADVLHDATRARVEYVFGDTVDGSSPGRRRRRRHVRARAAAAVRPGHRGRRALLPDPAAGLRATRACTRWAARWRGSARPPADLDGWYLMHNAPGGRVASLRPGRTPAASKAGLGLRVDPGSALPRDVDGQRALLSRAFAGVGWKAPMLVDAMATASDFAFTAVAQVRLPRWSRGRVALVGDAAACPTPLTGLGTSVALVQAYVLAGELARARGDHRAAFDSYEALARPYVTTAQQLPPGGVNGYAPRSAVAIRLRTASMRAMTHWPMRPILERQFAKAGDIALPDYTTCQAG